MLSEWIDHWIYSLPSWALGLTIFSFWILMHVWMWHVAGVEAKGTRTVMINKCGK